MITYEYVETRLIGAALDRPELLSVLNPSDFQIEQSQILWRAMRDCRNKFHTLSPDVFRDYMISETGVDLTKTISEYHDLAPATEEIAKHYAKTLVDLTRKARLDAEVTRISDIELPVDEKILSLQTIISSVKPRTVKPIRSMAEMTRNVIEKMETLFHGNGLPGVMTGIPTLDQVTGGFQKSDFNILAARPSIGKTAFAVNVALAVNKTAFVSAEQPANQIVQRMIAISGGFPVHKMRNPRKFDDSEWGKVTEGSKMVASLSTSIMDEPAPTIEEIHAWAGRAVELGSELIVIDYLQRIRAADSKMSNYDRISHVAMSLKEMARSYDIPVLALAQINRQGATNAKMEHLKGSGDIEQEADLIMLLNRDIESAPQSGTLSLEKNRHGPLVDIPLMFDTSTMRFGESFRQEDY